MLLPLLLPFKKFTEDLLSVEFLNLSFGGRPLAHLLLYLFHIYVIHILNRYLFLFMTSSFMLFAVFNFYKLLDEHLFIDVLASLGNVDENKQVEYYVAETQKVLSVRFAQLRVLNVLEKLLNLLVLDKILCDDLLLREFKQNLDHFAFVIELIEYLQHLQHQCTVDLPYQLIILDNIFNGVCFLILTRVKQTSILVVHVGFHGIEGHYYI